MTIASTEIRHPAAQGLQTLPPERAAALLAEAQVFAAARVQAAIPAITAAAEVAARAIEGGHRLVYAGAGSSGLMALADALELPGTFGIPADRAPVLFAGGAAALLSLTGAAEDDPAGAASDLAAIHLGPGDAVICVSASGGVPYTLAIAEGARAAGATLIGIANVADSALLKAADIAILLETGPEMVAGSTRLGAGTAAKIALNMISTLTGLRLGHVYEGHMVNLVADNVKLRDRAARMVAELSGSDLGAAGGALGETDGAVKPAILIAAGAEDRGAAEALLAAAGGRLDPALRALRAEPG